MASTRSKAQVQGSIGSKDRVETDGQTDRRTNGRCPLLHLPG